MPTRRSPARLAGLIDVQYGERRTTLEVIMENLTTVANSSWVPAIIAFAVVAGSINATMTFIKKAVKGTIIENHRIYRRLLPIFPAFIGVGIAPFLDGRILPVEFPLPIQIAAGILMGSLSAHIYSIWEANVARAVPGGAKEEVKEEIKKEDAPGAGPENPDFVSEDDIITEELDGKPPYDPEMDDLGNEP